MRKRICLIVPQGALQTQTLRYHHAWPVLLPLTQPRQSPRLSQQLHLLGLTQSTCHPSRCASHNTRTTNIRLMLEANLNAHQRTSGPRTRATRLVVIEQCTMTQSPTTKPHRADQLIKTRLVLLTVPLDGQHLPNQRPLKFAEYTIKSRRPLDVVLRSRDYCKSLLQSPGVLCNRPVRTATDRLVRRQRVWIQETVLGVKQAPQEGFPKVWKDVCDQRDLNIQENGHLRINLGHLRSP